MTLEEEEHLRSLVRRFEKSAADIEQGVAEVREAMTVLRRENDALREERTGFLRIAKHLYKALRVVMPPKLLDLLVLEVSTVHHLDLLKEGL